jgi:hypothetical protein
MNEGGVGPSSAGAASGPSAMPPLALAYAALNSRLMLPCKIILIWASFQSMADPGGPGQAVRLKLSPRQRVFGCFQGHPRFQEEEVSS